MSGNPGRLEAAVAALESPAQAGQFLRELLTPGELHDLALRWELVELLAAGVPQRQIAAKLGVSLCKITRGAKILKKRRGVVAALVAPEPAPVPAGKTEPAPVKKVEGKHGTRVARKP